MDDIFESKSDEQRKEKIDSFFKSPEELKKEELEEVSKVENLPIAKADKKNWKIFLIALAIFLILGLVAISGYFFWQYKKAMNNPNTAAVSNEAEKIAEKIKIFMELPEEVPTVATITDREKLQDQTFFANAQNGDKVLIYVQSKKAILYRPSSNKVIEITSLLSEASSGTETKVETEPEAESKAEEDVVTESVEKQAEKIENKVKVDVLNGSEIKGLAKETADKLSGIENVELAKVGNAQKSTYTKILVVDLSGKNEIAAKIIAEKVGGEVGSLPEGESQGIADILVIAGKL